MMIIDNNFDYELTKPFDYAKDGQLETAKTLVFHEPTMKDYVFLLRMKPILSQSQTKMAIEFSKMVDKESNDTIELSEKEQKDNTRMVLDNCENLDKYYDLFKSLILKKGICFVDGDYPMKDGIIEDISIQDMDNIMFEYTHRFIFPKQV